MPFLRLTLASEIDRGAAAALAEAQTELTAERLGKRRELTAVLVESSPASVWTVGASARRVAAHLEVSVTAGTNDAEQKAAFIRDAAALLRERLGGLDPATYVVIREFPATEWGYDGRTQAARAVGRAGHA